MQKDLVKTAIQTKLENSTQSLVLIKLAAMADQDQIVRDGVGSIADACNMSKVTLARHITALEKLGLVESIKVAIGQFKPFKLNL